MGIAYRTGPDIPDFARFNDIVESPHDFFPRRLSVKPMDLQDIDISSQPRDTLVDGIQDMFSGEASLVDLGPIILPHFRNR